LGAYHSLFVVVVRRKKKMYNVICEEKKTEFKDLALAMAFAKTLNKFVTIKGDNFEIVGMFGVDSVKDGKCPDGVAYDWNKASRIGAAKRR
jgi:hypothetical protein